MRVGGILIIGLGLGSLALGTPAVRAQDAAAQEKALQGTYNQNQACKGDGKDKKLVTIHDKEVE